MKREQGGTNPFVHRGPCDFRSRRNSDAAEAAVHDALPASTNNDCARGWWWILRGWKVYERIQPPTAGEEKQGAAGMRSLKPKVHAHPGIAAPEPRPTPPLSSTPRSTRCPQPSKPPSRERTSDRQPPPASPGAAAARNCNGTLNLCFRQHTLSNNTRIHDRGWNRIMDMGGCFLLFPPFLSRKEGGR